MTKPNTVGRFGSAAPPSPWKTDAIGHVEELEVWSHDAARAQLDTLTPVRQIMQRVAASVPQHLSIDEVRSLLVASGLSAVPVADESGAPVGVVSALAILGELPEYESTEVEQGFSSATVLDPFGEGSRDEFERSESNGGFRVMRVLCPAVSTIMQPLRRSVRDSSSVRAAARVMVEESLQHLPVVGSDGQLVGMLRALDLVGFLAGLPVPLPVLPPPARRRTTEA
jgi:CBS domain-containing protein